MIKQCFVLLLTIILLVTQINSKNVQPKASVVSPYNLIDDAQLELEELREIAEGSIQQAFNDLNSLTSDASVERTDILYKGALAIRQAYLAIDGDLTTIKDLANAAGKNISSCLTGREELLGSLVYIHMSNLDACMAASRTALTDIVNDSQYYVEILINKVDDLAFQLGRCEPESVLCISPIVTEIELQIVQMPQKIQVEVDKASELFEGWTTEIQTCTSGKIAAAASEGNTILEEISECANGILG